MNHQNENVNSEETSITEDVANATTSKKTETESQPEVDTENTFQQFGLSDDILKALNKLNFTRATPVQKACIPLLLEKEADIVALAKTGTGKTAAFGLPLVQKIEAQAGLQALVLCPTRELAQQVSLNLKNFGEFKKIKTVTVVGGESYDKQIRALRGNPEILVSTPGRLVDLMEQEIVDLTDVKYLVLDEADEMLSFGFQEALETIWNATSQQDLKTWLFSATMSRSIRNLAQKYLKHAEEVTLNQSDEKILVDSYACVIFEEDKEDALSLLIKNEADFYGIIFATTKKQVADLEIRLRGLGLDVDSLHGDKVQADRTRTIERMKSRKTKILVATDVAARGLDIQNLTHVVNFEIPWDVETYTHRVGRTARAGKAGTVWTMVKPKESSKLVRFERALNFKFKNLRIPLVEEVQVAQKLRWLSDISQRNIRENDLNRFEKALENSNNEALQSLSADAKQWLAKALDYFGQGEELRVKQPRALELRSSDSRSFGSGDRGGRSFEGRRSGGGGRGGYRSERSSDSRSERSSDSRSERSSQGRSDRRSDRSGSNESAERSASGSGERGFRGGRGGGFSRGGGRSSNGEGSSRSGGSSGGGRWGRNKSNDRPRSGSSERSSQRNRD